MPSAIFFVNGLATSRAQSMKSCVIGVRVRFVKVMTPAPTCPVEMISSFINGARFSLFRHQALGWGRARLPSHDPVPISLV